MIDPLGNHASAGGQNFGYTAMHEGREAALPVDLRSKRSAPFEHRPRWHPELPLRVFRKHIDDFVDVRSRSRAVAPRVTKFQNDLFCVCRHLNTPGVFAYCAQRPRFTLYASGRLAIRTERGCRAVKHPCWTPPAGRCKVD